MSKRPNTLFLNTAQHLWNALSAHGNPYLHTPNIDWLYHNGTSLSQSYCSDPVCAAARSSWATGLYTSETGVPFNGGHLRTDISDLGQVLKPMATRLSTAASGMSPAEMSVKVFARSITGIAISAQAVPHITTQHPPTPSQIS